MLEMSPLSSVDSDLERSREHNYLLHSVSGAQEFSKDAGSRTRAKTRPSSSLSSGSQTRNVRPRNSSGSELDSYESSSPLFGHAVRDGFQQAQAKIRSLEANLTAATAECKALRNSNQPELLRLREVLALREAELTRYRDLVTKRTDEVKKLSVDLDQAIKISDELRAEIQNANQGYGLESEVLRLTEELGVCKSERDQLISGEATMESRIRALESTIDSQKTEMNGLRAANTELMRALTALRQESPPPDHRTSDRRVSVPSTPIISSAEPQTSKERATVPQTTVPQAIEPRSTAPLEGSSREDQIAYLNRLIADLRFQSGPSAQQMNTEPRRSSGPSEIQNSIKAEPQLQQASSSASVHSKDSPRHSPSRSSASSLTSASSDHAANTTEDGFTSEQLRLLWGRPDSPRDALWLNELEKALPILIKEQPWRIDELRNTIAALRRQTTGPDKQLVLDRAEGLLNQLDAH